MRSTNAVGHSIVQLQGRPGFAFSGSTTHASYPLKSKTIRLCPQNPSCRLTVCCFAIFAASPVFCGAVAVAFSGAARSGARPFGAPVCGVPATSGSAIVYLYGKRLVAKEYLDEAFTNFVSGCHFEGNVVYGTTMGIMAPFGDFRCYDTTFSNNVGYTSHITGGWSVNLRAPTYFEVDRCQFVGNTAASSGSGFHCEKGTMNDSMTNGWVRNSLFHKNYSVTSGGAACGMIQLGWTNTWISGCTIVSNYIYGGIWAAVNTSCTQSNCVANCIMYMNDTNSGTQYRDVNGSADKQPYFHNCFISNGKFTDNGCLGKDQDPGFVDIASGNLQLRRDSVCVDKGDNEPWMFAGKIPDLAGRPRISGSSVDIGCYEYCPILRFILSIR